MRPACPWPTSWPLTAWVAGEGSNLLHRFVDGTEGRRVAPGLDDDTRSVHRQLAECALALQSVSQPAFGELEAETSAPGEDIETALNRRCELRVADPRRRECFAPSSRARSPSWQQRRPSLCHDDLHHGNVS